MTETCDYARTRSTRVKLGSGTCEPSTPDRLRSASRHVLSGLNTVQVVASTGASDQHEITAVFYMNL